MPRLTLSKPTKQEVGGSALLLLSAIIWGTAFVFQRFGSNHVGAFTFVGMRNVIATAVLIPIVIIFDKRNKATGGKLSFWGLEFTNKKILLIGGALGGLCLFAGSGLQQIGIATTDIGKAGFISALYIVIVPVLSLFLKKKPTVLVWFAVAISLVGAYFLCITESFTFETGDIAILASTLAFAIQIIVVDFCANRVDIVRFCVVQFFTCGLLSMIFAFIFEQPTFENIWKAIIPILYLGLLSSAIGFTIQVVGQKYVNSTVAALFMCLESVFALISGWLVFSESLLPREILGCVLMFVATVIANIPLRFSRNKDNTENQQ